MENQKEIEELKERIRLIDKDYKDDATEYRKVLETAIEALEKQIPKKPIDYEDKYYGCPNCNGVIMFKWEKYPTRINDRKNGLPYCLCCGQAIDWSDDEQH